MAAHVAGEGYTKVGLVHTDSDGRRVGTAIVLCQHAAPHVVPCVLQWPWNNDTHSFRTMEALWNQGMSFCAELVIFAQPG